MILATKRKSFDGTGLANWAYLVIAAQAWNLKAWARILGGRTALASPMILWILTLIAGPELEVFRKELKQIRDAEGTAGDLFEKIAIEAMKQGEDPSRELSNWRNDSD